MDELGEYHHAEEKPDKTKKMIGAIVLAVIVAGAAFYAVKSGMLSPAPKQAGQTYPRGL